jgi:hypothetical protein
MIKWKKLLKWQKSTKIMENDKNFKKNYENYEIFWKMKISKFFLGNHSFHKNKKKFWRHYLKKMCQFKRDAKNRENLNEKIPLKEWIFKLQNDFFYARLKKFMPFSLTSFGSSNNVLL